MDKQKTSVVGAKVQAVDRSTCQGKMSPGGKMSCSSKMKKEAKAEGEPIAQEAAEQEALKGRIGKQFKRRGSQKDPGEMAESIKSIKAKRASKK